MHPWDDNAPFVRTRRSAILLGLALAAPAAASDDTEQELEKYRQMLKADPWSNPGLLDADRGEALWKEKRGPKNASLEAMRSRQGSGQGRGRVRRAAALLQGCGPGDGSGIAPGVVHGEAAGLRARGDRQAALLQGQPDRHRAGGARHLRGLQVERREVRPAARACQGEGGAGARRGAVLPPPGADGFRLRHLPRRQRQAHPPADACPI